MANGQASNMPKASHRDKIIIAGLAVIHEGGFHGVGIQDIVDRAGVPKGSFYNHFKSKDSFGLEVLDFYWKKNAETRAVLRDSGVPALIRIEHYLEAVGYDEKGCLIGNFSSELAGSEVFRPRLSELFKLWAADLAACILDGQKDGTVRKDDSAKSLAEFVIGSLEGAILKAKVDRDPKVLKRLRKSVRLFLRSR